MSRHNWPLKFQPWPIGALLNRSVARAYARLAGQNKRRVKTARKVPGKSREREYPSRVRWDAAAVQHGPLPRDADRLAVPGLQERIRVAKLHRQCAAPLTLPTIARLPGILA
jgi:hypothetical protein